MIIVRFFVVVVSMVLDNIFFLFIGKLVCVVVVCDVEVFLILVFDLFILIVILFFFFMFVIGIVLLFFCLFCDGGLFNMFLFEVGKNEFKDLVKFFVGFFVLVLFVFVFDLRLFLFFLLILDVLSEDVFFLIFILFLMFLLRDFFIILLFELDFGFGCIEDNVVVWILN